MLLTNAGLLNYTGHMIGFVIMAFAACCIFLKMDAGMDSFFALHGRNYAWRIYLLSQPTALLVLYIASVFSPVLFNIVLAFGGIIVYLVCLLFAYLIGYALHLVRRRKGVRNETQI